MKVTIVISNSTLNPQNGLHAALTKMKFRDFKRSLGFRREGRRLSGWVARQGKFEQSSSPAINNEYLYSLRYPRTLFLFPHSWMAPDRLCNEYVMKGN